MMACERLDLRDPTSWYLLDAAITMGGLVYMVGVWELQEGTTDCLEVYIIHRLHIEGAPGRRYQLGARTVTMPDTGTLFVVPFSPQPLPGRGHYILLLPDEKRLDKP